MSVPPIVQKFGGSQPYRLSNNSINFVSNSPFFPNQVSNLAVWLDANDVNGDGTIPAVGKVLTWINKAKNTITCTAPTTVKAPSYTSLPSINFDNNDPNVEGYKLDYSIVDEKETVYIVLDYNYALDEQNQPINILYPDVDLPNGRQLFISDNGTLVSARLNGTILLSNGFVNYNTPTLINSINNGFDVGHYINGSNIEILETAGYSLFDNTFLGTDNYGPNGFTGNIYEVLIYSNTVLDTDRQKIESYLYHKWSNFTLDTINPYVNIPYSNYSYPLINSNFFTRTPYVLNTQLPTLNSNSYPLIRNLLRLPNRLSNVSFS